MTARELLEPGLELQRELRQITHVIQRIAELSAGQWAARRGAHGKR